jgi:hypothetical protein
MQCMAALALFLQDDWVAQGGHEQHGAVIEPGSESSGRVGGPEDEIHILCMVLKRDDSILGEGDRERARTDSERRRDLASVTLILLRTARRQCIGPCLRAVKYTDTKCDKSTDDEGPPVTEEFSKTHSDKSPYCAQYEELFSTSQYYGIFYKNSKYIRYSLSVVRIV